MFEKISLKSLKQQLGEQGFRPDNNGKSMTREQVILAFRTFEENLPKVSCTRAADYYIRVIPSNPLTYLLYVRETPI